MTGVATQSASLHTRASATFLCMTACVPPFRPLGTDLLFGGYLFGLLLDRLLERFIAAEAPLNRILPSFRVSFVNFLSQGKS